MMILTQAEIVELTNRHKFTSQAKELTAMRIPYRRRRDGSIVIIKEDLGHATKEKGQASPKLRI